MPGFDRSGPMGQGPMTGGRRGRCGPTGSAGDRLADDYGGGMGFRRRFGRGRGRGFVPLHGGYAGPPARRGMDRPSRTEELAMLRSDAEAMQRSLETVQRRIDELDTTETE